MHKVGDTVWRGYARHYGDGVTYWPEIRPGDVRAVHDDGTIDVTLCGVMPVREGRRSPGAWVAFRQPPERYHATPETALAEAHNAVAQCEDQAA